MLPSALATSGNSKIENDEIILDRNWSLILTKNNWLELFGSSNGIRFFIHKYYSWLIIDEAFNF